MSRIAYVNGRYLRHAEAAVHIEDRGYQFADGVYEVCEIRHGAMLDMTRHLDRLERSLRELQIAMPMNRNSIARIMQEVTIRNKVTNGSVYLQVTRGVMPRNHLFPPKDVRPALVVTAKSTSLAKSDAMAERGIAVISVPDNRWERVDIKTVGLLPNVLAKQAASEADAYEAWFVDGDGNVTEGSSTNAWIVTKDGVLVTRPAEHGILRGITREGVLDIIKARGMKVEEREFSIKEAQQAKEAFLTAATTVVMPVTMIDGESVGNGHPGSVTLEIRNSFFDAAEKQILENV